MTVRKQSSAIVLAISLTAPPQTDRYDLTLDPVALEAPGVTVEQVRDAVKAAGAKADPHIAHFVEVVGWVIATGVNGGPPGNALLMYYRVTGPDDFAPNGPAGADKLRVLSLVPSKGAAIPLIDVGRVDLLPGAYDGLFLSDYATLKLRDELSRVPGVGDVLVRGVGAYSRRVWLGRDKLAARKLTTEDVLSALRRQNVQVATGAGAASRQSLGTAVFGGMGNATGLAVYFVPVFYVAIQGLIEWLDAHKPPGWASGRLLDLVRLVLRS